MNPIEIHDDGFRATELGAYRLRINAMHVALATREIRRRWKRESGMSEHVIITNIGARR